MDEFIRSAACPGCKREYELRGRSVNPNNETQTLMEFRCTCGEKVGTFLPGSVNRELVKIKPVIA
jgi:hypothetical protein